MAEKKHHLKTEKVTTSVRITGKRVQIVITLPENVRKRLFHQLSKFEKD
jgi:hypothetical protein